MSVVTVAEAKADLNMTSAVSDAEVQSFLNRAEAALARKVGPLAATATTSRVRGGDWQLVLPVTPVISLTSVTPAGGTALTVGDLYVSPEGLVEYALTSTWFPSATYTVVYSAGRTTLPDDLKNAALRLTAHMWETQRGGGARPGRPAMEGLANTLPGSAYMFPHRVNELIAPHMQVGN